MSRAIERAAPSDITSLQACQLQFGFRKSTKGGGGHVDYPPAARLGSIAHRTLESVVSERSLFDLDQDSALQIAWETELEHERQELFEAGAHQRWGPPEAWRDYYLVRARLSVAVTILKGLLDPTGDNAEYLTESALVDPDTVLWGIPDLIVRSTDLHAVVDYKTGRAREPDSEEVRKGYRTQMHVYAYLEFKTSGDWPKRSLILSLQEGLIEIETGPHLSLTYIKSALETIAQYNESVPSIPPASPSARVCRYCRFVPRCDPFWQAAPGVAKDGYIAIRGTVTRIASTRLGGYTIEIQASPESAPIAHEVTIRRVDPHVHHMVEDLELGDTVCATNLYLVEDQESTNPEWRLGSSAQLLRLDA